MRDNIAHELNDVAKLLPPGVLHEAMIVKAVYLGALTAMRYWERFIVHSDWCRVWSSCAAAGIAVCVAGVHAAAPAALAVCCACPPELLLLPKRKRHTIDELQDIAAATVSRVASEIAGRTAHNKFFTLQCRHPYDAVVCAW